MRHLNESRKSTRKKHNATRVFTSAAHPESYRANIPTLKDLKHTARPSSTSIRSLTVCIQWQVGASNSLSSNFHFETLIAKATKNPCFGTLGTLFKSLISDVLEPCRTSSQKIGTVVLCIKSSGSEPSLLEPLAQVCEFRNPFSGRGEDFRFCSSLSDPYILHVSHRTEHVSEPRSHKPPERPQGPKLPL